MPVQVPPRSEARNQTKNGGENLKEKETKWDLTVLTVKEHHEWSQDKDGNPTSKTVHTAILANEDGVKFAISRDTPLPWDVKNPVTVTVYSPQSKLEDHA